MNIVLRRDVASTQGAVESSRPTNFARFSVVLKNQAASCTFNQFTDGFTMKRYFPAESFDNAFPIGPHGVTRTARGL